MKCADCGIEINIHSDDEPKTIDGKPVSKECYYSKLGEVVEQHPIGMPISKQQDQK